MGRVERTTSRPRAGTKRSSTSICARPTGARVDLGLHECVALVAGSTRGIGRAIATRFLEEGASVLVSGRDSHALKETCEHLSARFSGQRLTAFNGDLRRA